MAAIEIKGLDHIVLRTDRLAEVLAFYRDRLGLPVVRTNEAFGLYHLAAGSTLIDIADGSVWKAEGGGEAHYLHFCLQVAADDLDTLVRWLDERGLDHDEPGERFSATGQRPAVYLRDPDGRTVELALLA